MLSEHGPLLSGFPTSAGFALVGVIGPCESKHPYLSQTSPLGTEEFLLRQQLSQRCRRFFRSLLKVAPIGRESVSFCPRRSVGFLLLVPGPPPDENRER